ncbi:hypothetical protein [Lichenicoccus sp.]|uniref:hypothetical protein n=1 Tax=Lichenicoccus sp. TaxID=2781899 RepID=UPI003D0DFF20
MQRFAACALIALIGAATLALPQRAQAQPFPPVPPPRYEPVPVAPGPGYSWRGGGWRWDGRGYAWMPGAYVIRRPGYHQWVPGHWGRFGGWIPAHWR